MQTQLKEFRKGAHKTFPSDVFSEAPKDWRDALDLLTEEIRKTDKKVVLFFDELPLLSTPLSKLLNAIDYFWNNKWSGMRNVIFIACGSSASWILKNIIYNTGGLHNRTTQEIHLKPFNLAETREYFESKKIQLNNRHIISLYMAIGGIPYYLNYVKHGLSAQQNIQQLFFDTNAPLQNEYYKLFESLFNDADDYKELLEIISKNKEGISAESIGENASLSSRGGR
jgi:uncharacterized protein